MDICLYLIATGKYKQFVPSLLKDVEEFFLPDHNIIVNLFIDDNEFLATKENSRVQIVNHSIPSYKFPYATLYRYKIFTSILPPDADYTFYLDVDMSIKQPIGEEILGHLVAVQHPGFYRGGGSWENDTRSAAYTIPTRRNKYYAGGFQGGQSGVYYVACQALANRIAQDEFLGIKAEWNDESHWNKLLSEYDPKEGKLVVLNPSYCMVEQEHLRKEWGIDMFPAKIIALAKDHEKIRS